MLFSLALLLTGCDNSNHIINKIKAIPETKIKCIFLPQKIFSETYTINELKGEVKDEKKSYSAKFTSSSIAWRVKFPASTDISYANYSVSRESGEMTVKTFDKNNDPIGTENHQCETIMNKF